MIRKPYRLLPHTADIRFRIQARTFPALLSRAVFALADQMVEARRVARKMRRKVRVTGATPEERVVGLLQECLFLFDARRFVARAFRKDASRGNVLSGWLVGERFSEKMRPKSEIKAATFHGLKVRRRGGAWTADVVLDV